MSSRDRTGKNICNCEDEYLSAAFATKIRKKYLCLSGIDLSFLVSGTIEV